MDLPVTFLADLLGIPRETASRVCGKLQDFGLIIMEKKKIYIPDPAKMAAYSEIARILNNRYETIFREICHGIFFCLRI